MRTSSVAIASWPASTAASRSTSARAASTRMSCGPSSARSRRAPRLPRRSSGRDRPPRAVYTAYPSHSVALMFLPIHDDNPRRRTPVVTILLIGASLLAWFFVEGTGDTVPLAKSLCELGMTPGNLTGRAIGEAVPLGNGMVCIVDAQPAWHTVLTSMFLHADWLHLLGNLWFLWLFGDNVEDDLGHIPFLVFYLLCGVAAAGLQLLIDPASPVPMVGASGAISGVMGAYVIRYPRVPVRVLVILIIFFFTVRVSAWL